MSNVNIRIRDEEELVSREDKLERMGDYNDSSDYSYRKRDTRQEKITNIDLEKRKWKNRRKMAWISLFCMIFLTLILLFAPIPDNRLKIITEPIIWSYFAFTSVIGAYMGFTAYAMKGR